MKKSFMTRALAMGLSFAMAFSLSAATNVTTASAAAKKASVTTFMKASSKTVTEGKSVTAYMKSGVAKKYRIKSHTESDVAKKYISVKMLSSRKGLTITAVDGAVTAANLEKKGVNTKIYFAPAKSASAVKKAKATKYVNLKVAVKAAPKQEEEVVAYSIVDAKVTGVKTIVLTMNKDVEPELVGVTATLKKGSTAKAQTIKADGKTITMTTDAKLTAGTYSISITGLETEALPATVNVEKNETLTKYVIGEELIPQSTTVTTKGYIYFKALNQYDEMMTASAPKVTCSFSTGGSCGIASNATAEHEGKIYVNDINSSLAILGQTGTVVLVDNNSGVNATGTVKYATPATADKAEVVGMYNTTRSKFEDITANDNANNYMLLLKITDQYGHEQDVSQIAADVTFTLAGGITNLNYAGKTDYTVDGKDYVALKFAGTVREGDAILTVVNGRKGLLLNHTITVNKYTVISSFTATADALYDKEENTLEYEAVDNEGNVVTSYAILINTVGFMDAPSNCVMGWKKNSDGSAKLVWNMKNSSLSVPQNADKTGSTTLAMTYSLNDNISKDYKVTTNTYTVYNKKIAKAVHGLKSGTATQFATGRDKLEIGFDKIVYEDQFANSLEKGAAGYPASVTYKKWTTGVAAPGQTSVYYETTGSMKVAIDSDNSKFVFQYASASDSATVYMKYANTIKGAVVMATKSDYDFKFTVGAVDTTEADAESLKIASVNDGWFVDYANNANGVSTGALKVGQINVTAKIGGVDIRIPDEQVEIKGYENNSFTAQEIAAGIKEKTAKVKVQATVFDKNNIPTVKDLEAEYTIAISSPYAYKVDGVRGDTIVPADSAKLTAIDIEKAYKFKDQYGNAFTSGSKADTHVKYYMYADNTKDVKVYGENITEVYATTDVGQGTYSFKITATAANGKKDDERTFSVRLTGTTDTTIMNVLALSKLSPDEMKSYTDSVATEVVSYSALDTVGQKAVAKAAQKVITNSGITNVTKADLIAATSQAAVTAASVYNTAKADELVAVTKEAIITTLGFTGNPYKVVTSKAITVEGELIPVSVTASAIVTNTGSGVTLASSGVVTGDAIALTATYKATTPGYFEGEVEATYIIKVIGVTGSGAKYTVENTAIKFVK